MKELTIELSGNGNDMDTLIKGLKEMGVPNAALAALDNFMKSDEDKEENTMPIQVPTVAGNPVNMVQYNRDVRIQVLPSGWIITNLVGVRNTVDVFTDMPKMLKHLERILARG